VLLLTSLVQPDPASIISGEQGKCLAMHNEVNKQHTQIYASMKTKNTSNFFLASLHSLSFKSTQTTACQPLSRFSLPDLRCTQADNGIAPLSGTSFCGHSTGHQLRLVTLRCLVSGVWCSHYFENMKEN
jgi:hypothetical protein